MREIILSICLLLVFPAQNEEWKLKVDEGGIQVFTKHVEGSSIKEFRATVTVKAHPDQVLDIISKYASYPDWIPYCRKVTILKNNEGSNDVIRSEINTPFPASDRDLVQTVNVIQKTDGYIIEVNTLPDYYPDQKGYIRMKSDGQWKLQSLGNGETYVEMQFLNDPMGYIPSAIVNTMISKSPFNSLSGLRDQLAQGKGS